MNNKEVSKVGKVSKVSKEWPRRAFDTSGTFGTFTTSNFGFTLIELLVVITILGVLSSIGLGNFMNSQMKGRDTQRKSDLHQLQNALEFFYSDKGKYPGASSPTGGSIEACPFAQDSASPCTWGKDSMTDKDGSGNVRTTYLQRVPEDPKNNPEYCYKTSSDGAKYQLFAKLENTNDPDILTGVTLTCGSDTYNFGAASSNTNLGETL